MKVFKKRCVAAGWEDHLFKAPEAGEVGAREYAAAVVAGICGGWFLAFLGANIPNLFGFEPQFSQGEAAFVLLFFGISFGSQLAKAMARTSATLLFTAVIFVYIIISMVVAWPPIFFGGAFGAYAAVAAMPAIFIFALYMAKILRPGENAEKAVALLGTSVALPIFWFHIAYVFVYPLALKVYASPTNTATIINFAILAVLWVVIIPASYYTLKSATNPQKK